MPNTIVPPRTENSGRGLLMSGGAMRSPSALTSSTSSVTRSALRISEVMLAAMNSAGWCVFSQAVRRVSTA